MSKIFGVSKFFSIIFSSPLPIEQIRKIWGSIPKNVAKKKLDSFTLNIQGKTQLSAQGTPPQNL